jgi:multidrug efflux pump subunit AcrB
MAQARPHGPAQADHLGRGRRHQRAERAVRGGEGWAVAHIQPQELVYTITTKGRLSEAREFEEIIVRANGAGDAVRLRDVARVELGGKDYDFIGRINGKPATLVGIFLQPAPTR